MNPYLELKNRHQKEMNAFPLGFAFNEQQFSNMMRNWGLDPSETDKIYRIPYGGFVRKSDADAFHEMIDRHEREVETARTENKNDYLYHMFNYELANHEYNYTGELGDTLDALGLTYEEVKANAVMYDALQKAIKHQHSLDW
jgi:hypothetical protein